MHLVKISAIVGGAAAVGMTAVGAYEGATTHPEYDMPGFGTAILGMESAAVTGAVASGAGVTSLGALALGKGAARPAAKVAAISGALTAGALAGTTVGARLATNVQQSEWNYRRHGMEEYHYRH